jgi:hypothetical protein
MAVIPATMMLGACVIAPLCYQQFPFQERLFMLSFPESIRYLYDKLISGEKFALGRFGDGEWGAIKGAKFSPGNGEWQSDGTDPIFEGARQNLADALRYQHPQYYTAICPCYTEMLQFSRQPSTQVTYANIFVNANYPYYKEHFIKAYRDRDVWLVANRSARLENLPFPIERFFPVDYNAWMVNSALTEQIMQEGAQDKLFLFSAGPFANILAHQLWETNKNNVYLDVGSTLDTWILPNSLNKRDYYMGDTVYARLSCPCDGVRPACH